MKKYIIYLSVLYLAIGSCLAQRKVIQGVVKDADSNSPTPGVCVVQKGTRHGTITDLDGNFSIELIDSSSVLTFSFIGYLTVEMDVSDKRLPIEVLLQPDLTSLDEVVVVGYSTIKKSMLTGAVSSVRGRDMTSALRGKASGVTVTDTYSESANTSYTAGTLTAGEINDFSKWKLWKDLSDGELKEYKHRWNIHPDNRYTVQLNSKEGLPLIGASIQLYAEDELLWETTTDNTGKAELWATYFNNTADKNSKRINIQYNGKTYEHLKVKPFKKGVTIIDIDASFSVPKNVDIAFIVDATGSMGDEINYLKTELGDIIERAADSLPEQTINLASVFYRDTHDEYLTRKSDFSAEIKNTTQFIKTQNANGGGDFPEAVHSGLEEAINNLNWSSESLTKIAFLVLDAPPHQNNKVNASIESSIRTAAKKGIRLVPVTCSGIDKSTEYLMRSMALLTNGTYVFLTDDSGVGNPHIKPSTDEYSVEMLNDLIVRLIMQYTRVPDLKDLTAGVVADTLSIQKLINYVEVDTIKDETNTAKTPYDLNPTKDAISLKCFPNPNHGIVNIESNKGIKEIFICDLSGKIVQRETFNKAHSMKIDISGYPIGTYIISYEYDNDKWLSGKIVLVR